MSPLQGIGATPRLTSLQIENLRHMLGMNTKKPGYRNFFLAGIGSDDEKSFMVLVELGYCKRGPEAESRPSSATRFTPTGVALVSANSAALSSREEGVKGLDREF